MVVDLSLARSLHYRLHLNYTYLLWVRVSLLPGIQFLCLLRAVMLVVRNLARLLLDNYS